MIATFSLRLTVLKGKYSKTDTCKQLNLCITFDLHITTNYGIIYFEVSVHSFTSILLHNLFDQQ